MASAAEAADHLRRLASEISAMFDVADEDFDPTIDFDDLLGMHDMFGDIDDLLEDVDQLLEEVDSIGSIGDLISDIDEFEAELRGDLPSAKRGKKGMPPSSTSRAASVHAASVREAKSRLELLFNAINTLGRY